MSRPLVWNGTSWRDPSFHVGGGSYKTYIPPAYDQMAGSSDFTTGLDGFVKNSGTSGASVTWDPAGYAVVAGPGGFLQDYGMRYDRPDSELSQYSGRPVRLDVRYRLGDGDGNNLMGWVWEYQVDYQYTTVEMPDETYLINDGNWHELSSPVVTFKTYSPGSLGPISTRMLLYGGGRCEVDYQRLVDVSTGQVVLALGDPGWAPKVRRSDGTWK